jgi:hypothetical protein
MAKDEEVRAWRSACMEKRVHGKGRQAAAFHVKEQVPDTCKKMKHLYIHA